jgi:D-tyrosyl-tRNA(Tyr) deacylase
LRAVLQRVHKAKVEVEGRQISSISKGLLIFVGVENNDSLKEARLLADKIANLRIFSQNNKFSLSVKEVNGEILVVSQFTLLANCRKGRRPSFTKAAPPEVAKELYQQFITQLSNHNIQVEQGIFQAKMAVSLANDGPVTIILDTKEWAKP